LRGRKEGAFGGRGGAEAFGGVRTPSTRITGRTAAEQWQNDGRKRMMAKLGFLWKATSHSDPRSRNSGNEGD